MRIGVYSEGKRVGEYKVPVKNVQEALAIVKLLAIQENTFKVVA